MALNLEQRCLRIFKLSQSFKQYNLFPAELNALCFIAEYGPITSAALAKMLKVATPSAHVLVQVLKEKHLITEVYRLNPRRPGTFLKSPIFLVVNSSL